MLRARVFLSLLRVLEQGGRSVKTVGMTIINGLTMGWDSMFWCCDDRQHFSRVLIGTDDQLFNETNKHLITYMRAARAPQPQLHK